MVKALFLGLLAATMCGLASAAPAPQIAQRTRGGGGGRDAQPPSPTAPADEDPVARSERSTNLSHITGTARKIQMFIKNRHLQLLPDGIVNGTTDDTSPYTILQRTSVGIGQMKIQGIATCQYLCMDSCGLLYGSRDFDDECIFNESIGQHNYNTYSSTKYSNEKRTLYLALNRRGQPRKVQLRARQQLGRLSSYTRALTRTVTPERAEELLPLRHRGHNVCSAPPPEQTAASHASDPTDDAPTEHLPRCRKRKKRKKKKRRCQDGEADGEPCQKRQLSNARKVHTRLVKQCDNDKSEECQRVEVTMKKKHKTKTSDTHVLSGGFKKKKSKKQIKRRQRVSASSEDNVTEEVSLDEDYAVDATTAWDWEDTTVMPLLPDDSVTHHPD